MWQEWLPDIYLNPHGYPSHEWVQQFAGYVPPQFRTYWSTRGWYTIVTGAARSRAIRIISTRPSALREAIVREINANADVRDMNLRAQARYRRWAYGFAPYVYSQEIYKDTAIYFSDHGDRRAARIASRRCAARRGGDGGGGGALLDEPVAAGHVHVRQDRIARRDRARRVARSSSTKPASRS